MLNSVDSGSCNSTSKITCYLKGILVIDQISVVVMVLKIGVCVFSDVAERIEAKRRILVQL